MSAPAGAPASGRPEAAETATRQARGSLPWTALRHEPALPVLLAQGATAATAVVANVLAARALEPSGRGTLALLLQVGYLLTQLVLLGGERAFVAGWQGVSPATASRAWTRLLVRPAGVLVSLGVALAVLAPGPLERHRGAVLVVTAFALANAVLRAVRSGAIATGRSSAFLRTSMASNALLLLLLGVLHGTGSTSAVTWTVAYLVACVLPVGAAVLRARRSDEEPPQAHPSIARTRKEGLSLLPASLANTASLRGDRFLLAALASTTALGLYATVATVTELLSWPVLAYVDTRLGRWRAAAARGRLRAGRLVLGACVLVALAAPLLAGALHLVVVPLLGPAFRSSTELVLPLVLAAAVHAVGRVSVGLLVAQSRSALSSAVESTGFAVTLVAYVVLIPAHGALGAAWASLTGCSVVLALATAAAVRPPSDTELVRR